MATRGRPINWMRVEMKDAPLSSCADARIDFDGIGVGTPTPEAPTPAMMRAYGDLAFLYFRSAYHRRLPVRAARLFLQPPIDLGFVHVFRNGDVPRAAVTWAFLSTEAERRFAGGEPLQPAEWRSGQSFWIVEIIAPFDEPGPGVVMRRVVEAIAARRKGVRYLRTDESGAVRRIVESKLLPNNRLGARLISTGDLQPKNERLE